MQDCNKFQSNKNSSWQMVWKRFSVLDKVLEEIDLVLHWICFMIALQYVPWYMYISVCLHMPLESGVGWQMIGSQARIPVVILGGVSLKCIEYNNYKKKTILTERSLSQYNRFIPTINVNKSYIHNYISLLRHVWASMTSYHE